MNSFPSLFFHSPMAQIKVGCVALPRCPCLIRSPRKGTVDQPRASGRTESITWPPAEACITIKRTVNTSNRAQATA